MSTTNIVPLDGRTKVVVSASWRAGLVAIKAEREITYGDDRPHIEGGMSLNLDPDTARVLAGHIARYARGGPDPTVKLPGMFDVRLVGIPARVSVNVAADPAPRSRPWDWKPANEGDEFDTAAQGGIAWSLDMAPAEALRVARAIVIVVAYHERIADANTTHEAAVKAAIDGATEDAEDNLAAAEEFVGTYDFAADDMAYDAAREDGR